MTSSKRRILVVDDEPKVIHLIREILSAAGYEVLIAINGEKAIQISAVENPDIILLDIMLSDRMDGYEVARRLRKFSKIPIIMLTAKVRESDLLMGFESGADDYLFKPFSSKELLVRIKAVLKRSQDEGDNVSNSIVHCGNLKIDLACYKVTRGDEEIHLTPTEFELLCQFARHPNQVMVHEYLLTSVWGPEYRNDNDYLRAYIRYLRKKIEPDPSNPIYILRCPGVGYSLVCNDDRDR